MLRLRDKNSDRNEASGRLSKIPDPLCSLPEAGLAPALHWSLRSCRKCGTTSSDAIYYWLRETAGPMLGLFDFKPSLSSMRGRITFCKVIAALWASRRACDPRTLQRSSPTLWLTSAIGKPAMLCREGIDCDGNSVRWPR
jgi:hypothetical protein